VSQVLITSVTAYPVLTNTHSQEVTR